MYIYEINWDEQHYAEVKADSELSAWGIARNLDRNTTYSAIVGDIQVVKDTPLTKISDEIVDAYQNTMAKYTEIKEKEYEVIYNDDE